MTLESSFNRLPKSIKPINYELELRPNLINFTFNGSVTIDVEVTLIDLILF
jgi:hypothetical protein